MSKILLRGGSVITMSVGGDVSVLTSTDVAIADGLIAAVGETRAGFEPEQVVDARRHIVMSGLFNAHMHSGTVYSRGLAPYAGLDPWFDLRATQDGQLQREPGSPLTAEDAYWSALLACAELIRGGVVGFGDQYFFMDVVARAAVESGLRANLSWCTFGAESDDARPGGGEIGGDIAEVAAFVQNWQGAGGGRIKTSLGPHSAYLCTPQFLARTAAVAARLGAGIHLRAAESQEQVDLAQLAYDMTPVELLDKNGVLDVPVRIANATYLKDVDVAILAARGACVAACLTAQAAAGVDSVPIERLQAAGVTVGLGTDGAGLVGALNLFDEMRDAAINLRQGLAGRAEALRLATWGGAQALGFTNSGIIAPGYCADLIMIDTRRDHLWPVRDPLAAVLTSAGPGDVTDVLVGGQWLMRDGGLTTIDEGQVLAEVESRAARLFGARTREAA